jgi:hypothetical protein
VTNPAWGDLRERPDHGVVGRMSAPDHVDERGATLTGTIRDSIQPL